MHPPPDDLPGSPAPGPELDGKFAAILDRWAEVYAPDHWPVSVVRDSLEALRSVGQYGGGNPALLPRAGYRARRLEATRLLNARTGELEPAGLYRLEAKGGGRSG